MARPQKTGLDYFNVDTDIESNRKVRLLMGKFGLLGLGVWLHFHNAIYANGYYLPIDNEAIELSASYGLCEPEKLEEIVEYMLNKKIFNRDIYEKYNLLTSKEIQSRFLAIVYRRKKILINPKIWLCDFPDRNDPETGEQNLKLLKRIIYVDINGVIVNNDPFHVRTNPINDNINPINDNINPINDNINEQRRIEERRKKCIGSAVMRQTQLLKTCENQHCFHRKITCKYKLIFNEFS